MEKLNKDILQIIPDNWLENFDRVAHRFEKIEGYLKKVRNKICVDIIGGKFQASVDSVNLSGRKHNFSCRYASCDAEIRIYGELQSFVVDINEICQFERDVELIRIHTCEYGCKQRQTLRYLDILRVHLIKNANHRLNSYTGFYIYQPGFGSTGMMNAPFGILDHLFKSYKSKQKAFEHCHNNRKMICGKKSKAANACNTTVYVRQRDTYTCKVICEDGSQSSRTDRTGGRLFECVPDDEIEKIKSPCSSTSFHMYKANENVLSNGLKKIIPFLEYFVIQCGWTDGFHQYDFDLNEDIENAIEASRAAGDDDYESMDENLEDEIQMAKRSIDDVDTDDEEGLLALEIKRAKICAQTINNP